MVLSGTRDLARPDEPQRAMDLSMKLQVLRARSATTDRAATFATGTPIPNSPREMWVMLDYLRPDLLRAAGVEHFDAWAANHLRPETRLEMKITGAGFAPRTRITRFVNVPEMTRMWRQMADQVTRDDLDVQLPPSPPGGRSTTAMPRSAEQTALQRRPRKPCRRRPIRGRPNPDEDNILKISSATAAKPPSTNAWSACHRTRPAAGSPPLPAPSSASTMPPTKDRVYLDDTADPSPRTGGLQIVFCDQSTPKPGQWNVYTALRDDLIDAGMPPDRIRFIHEAVPDAQRADLFAAARDGRIHVLIGSTHKMGTGANIQARAVGLHHLDVPWRPSDLEQREGRILRQGNQNTRTDRSQIHTYVTESTFDAFSWTPRHRQGPRSSPRSRTAAPPGTSTPTTPTPCPSNRSPPSPPATPGSWNATNSVSTWPASAGCNAPTTTNNTGSFEARPHRARRHHHPLPSTRPPPRGDHPDHRRRLHRDHRRPPTRRPGRRRPRPAELIAANNPEPGNLRRVDQIIGRIGGLDLRMHADPVLHHKIHLSFPALEPVNQASTIHGDAAYVDTADLNSATTPGLGLVRRLEHHLLALPAKLEQMQGSLAAAPTRIAETRALIGARSLSRTSWPAPAPASESWTPNSPPPPPTASTRPRRGGSPSSRKIKLTN